MLKKILPFLIILLVIVPVALFLVFFKDKRLPDSQIDAMEAVPVDAIIAIETKSVPSLLQLINTRRQMRDDLMMLASLNPWLDGLGDIDSLLTGEDSFSARYGTIPGVFSIHQTGDKHFAPLLVLQASGRFGFKAIEDLIDGILPAEFESDHKSYERTRIDQLTFAEGSRVKNLYACQLKKYILLSTDDILIESAIRQVKEGVSLNQDDYFRKASSVAGLNADAGLYVNLKRIGEVSTGILSKDLGTFISKFNRYGSWAELDLTLREDMVYGTGFGFKTDTLSWLGIFNHQEPPKNTLDRVLPANTIGFITYGFSQPETFLRNVNDLYAGTDFGKNREKSLAQTARLVGEDLTAAFSHIIDHEAVLAWIPGAGDQPVPLMITTLKSQHMASEKLLDWISAKARKEGKGVQDYREKYSLDAQSTYYVYRSPVDGIPGMLFGEMFSEVTGKYFGFLDNELVFSDNPQAIRDLIYFKVLEKTLYTDPVYQSVLSQVGMRNNFVFYFSPFRSAAFVEEFLSKKWAGAILSNPDFLKRTAAVSLQIQSGNNGLFHNFFVKFSGSELSGPQTLWESRLDTTINFKPVFTTNHNTNRKEILLQDEAHNLYLVNTSGRQLWKVPLKEAIMSEVFQIDYLKNGKLQFLFSTASGLHLIDRNGNYVTNFPVMLRSEATNGMALFDYDNRQDYRIFIAGKDRSIYVYDKAGALVKGWDFGKTEGVVEQEIKHFRIGSRDYIVFADAMRVYITDRQGNARVTPEKQFAKSARNGLVLDRQSAEGPRLVGTDVNGMIWSVYFNGKVAEQKTEGYSADHFFVFEDVDGDGRQDYIFADQDRLDVLNASGKRIFREKVPGYITHSPNIYVFPGNSREIGIVNRNEESIYLFKADGNQHAGFPLRGRTPFSIGYLDPGNPEFNLIVGGDDKFLLNYRVK